MKKTTAVALFSTIIMVTACSTNIDVSLNKGSEEDAQTKEVIATPPVKEQSIEEKTVTEKTVEIKTGEKQNHPGVIKSLSQDKIYGDFAYVLESTDGVQTGVTSCDKRTQGVWNEILLIADKNIKVDLYGKETTGGLCVNGIVVDTGTTNTAFNGVIKDIPLEKQYGDFAYTLEDNNETQIGLTSCDQRTQGIWEQIVSTSETNTPVFVFGSETQGGICVNGIVVKL